MQKYNNDMDCINIINDIRMLKIFTKSILNENIHKIAYFDHTKVLKSLDHKDDNKDEIIKLIPTKNSKNKHKKAYYDKISKFIKSYSMNEMTNLDYKIIENTIDDPKNDNIKSNTNLFTASNEISKIMSLKSSAYTNNEL